MHEQPVSDAGLVISPRVARHCHRHRARDKCGESEERDCIAVPLAPQTIEHSAGVRIGRELLEATRPFASEIKLKSRSYVVTTFILTIAVPHVGAPR